MQVNLIDAAASCPPVMLGGAFDGLSAKIVQEVGFAGVWASSFSISAAHGLPDIGLMGITDYFSVLADMRMAVSLPIVADCEAGLVPADQVHRVVKRFGLLGIDAIAIEDSKGPRASSLYDVPRRELEPTEVYASKIMAAKDASKEYGDGLRPLVFARTEALVARQGVPEALSRCRAYAAAGADAVIVQTNERTPASLFAVSKEWDEGVPLVAVPTTYSDTPAAVLAANGYGILVYAHQAIRAAVSGMEAALLTILREGRLAADASGQASIVQIARLTGTRE